MDLADLVPAGAVSTLLGVHPARTQPHERRPLGSQRRAGTALSFSSPASVRDTDEAGETRSPASRPRAGLDYQRFERPPPPPPRRSWATSTLMLRPSSVVPFIS